VREAGERRRQTKANVAKDTAARLEGQKISFTARSGEGDRLYGSITSHDIAEELAKVAAVEVEHHHVVMEHPIKMLGEHPVTIRLGAGATATITVVVERDAA
jgi:large subunit ribosomal protein L9